MADASQFKHLTLNRTWMKRWLAAPCRVLAEAQKGRVHGAWLDSMKKTIWQMRVACSLFYGTLV